MKTSNLRSVEEKIAWQKSQVYLQNRIRMHSLHPVWNYNTKDGAKGKTSKCESNELGYDLSWSRRLRIYNEALEEKKS